MIYSVKRFSLLDSFENLDEKIVEKRREQNIKTCNWEKKFLDKIGLGKTKFGKGLKDRLDTIHQAVEDKDKIDLEVRRKLLRGYKSNKKSKE